MFESSLEFFEPYWLGKEVERPLSQRLDRRLEIPISSDQNDLDVRVPLLEGAQEVEAIHIRHHDVADNDVGPILLKALEALSPVGGEDDFVSHFAQKGAGALADHLVVIDQEDLDLALFSDGRHHVSLFSHRFVNVYCAVYLGNPA